MITHKKTISSIDKFIDFNKNYKEKLATKKVTKEDEDKWIELYENTLKLIIDYNVDQIDFNKQE